MGEFFARIWRLIKTVLIAIPVLIVIAILESIVSNISGDKENFIFSTLGVALFICLGITVVNWFISDFLNVSFLDNGFGKFIKILMYAVCLLVAILIQVSFASITPSSYTLFDGKPFKDVLIMTGMFAPFVSLYFGFKASLDESFTEEYLWLATPYSVGGGIVIAIAMSILTSILPFLQGWSGWLFPVLSIGALVVIMFICRSIPFIEFDYYTPRSYRNSYRGGGYSSGRTSSGSSSRESGRSLSGSSRPSQKDWWNK